MALPKYVRPQKHNSWFNVLPEKDFANLKSPKVPFLESYVTVEACSGEAKYIVRYEGVHPMRVELHFGFICVWFGDDLETPKWPFPELFDRSFGKDFVIIPPRVFKDTNLLDLIENNGDQLHFKTVHQWLSVRIAEHEYTDRHFRLSMSGTVQYGRSADSAITRTLLSAVPVSTYEQDLTFHGPGFGGGKITTDTGLEAQLVLAFTPVGEHDLKLYLATSIDETTLPAWLRAAFRLSPVSLHDTMAWVLAKAGMQDTDGDYRIWRHKRSISDPRLLPGEADIIKIREWMSQYYLEDFEQPVRSSEAGEQEKRWVELAPRWKISAGKVHPFTVAGEEVIAYRTDTGKLQVFEAHCPHQGAHLGRGGQLKDDCVTCPFHDFHFNGAGEFVGTRPGGKVNSRMKLGRIKHRVSRDVVEVLV
jgi:phenylpropionate dioxygenase-like ring-hydroxylating dioxygenase large terminal subunit